MRPESLDSELPCVTSSVARMTKKLLQYLGPMYFTRALILALVTYGVTFVVGMITGMALGYDFESGGRPPEMLYLVGLISSVIVSYLVALQYFKKKEIIPSPRAGAYLGLVTVLVGFLIDTALIYPQLAAGKTDVLVYWAHPLFVAAIAAVIATTAFVGYTLAQEKK